MRFSQAAILCALPLLVIAEEEQQAPLLDSLKAKGIYYLNQLQSFLPSGKPSSFVQIEDETSDAPATDGSPPKIERPVPAIENLTLETWKETLQSTPVTSTKSEHATTDEWFVLLTGGNKTCYGLCGQIESSFNESATLFAQEETHPNLALLNCESERILCNSWAAGPSSLYIISVPSLTLLDAKTPLYIHSLNLTTTTPETYVELWKTGSYKEKGLYEGYFHPFDGQLAKYGAAVPLAYLLFFFSFVPSWAFVIGVPLISRTLTSLLMKPKATRAAPAGRAPSGDAR